jgi:hypothetical protein
LRKYESKGPKLKKSPQAGMPGDWQIALWFMIDELLTINHKP